MTSALPIRRKPEIDDRPCFLCGKTIVFATKARTFGEGHVYAIAIHPETKEFRWTHALCGVNHHVAGRRRRRAIVCANCGLPLVGEHMNSSGERFTYEQIVAAAPNADARAAIDVGASYGVGGWAQCRDGGLYVRGRDPLSERPASSLDVPLPDDVDFPSEALNGEEEEDSEHPSDAEADGHSPPF
jgi:hypothetical protein